MNPTQGVVKTELDRLSAEFFRAVSFEPGGKPPFDNIHELFVPMGLLIKNSGATPGSARSPSSSPRAAPPWSRAS